MMDKKRTLWDERYVRLARIVASWSKDPSTQCGAVLVRPNNTLASVGYNGFPRGVKDDADKYLDRNEKYPHILHSEWNALADCKDPSVEGYGVYAWPMPPCDECTAPMVQKGINKAIFPPPDEEKLPRWRESFDTAMDMWKQTKAVVRHHQLDDEKIPQFEGPDKWHLRFLYVAKEVASWSKDQIEPRGAVIARDDKSISSIGFNGYPQGIDDTPLIENHPNSRSAKLISAEKNAILLSQDNKMSDCTAYTWPNPPSLRDVIHLIQQGITNIVSVDDGVDIDSRIIDVLKDVGGNIKLLKIDNEFNIENTKQHTRKNMVI